MRRGCRRSRAQARRSGRWCEGRLVSAARLLLLAIGELPLFDREHAVLGLDIFHEADAAGLVGELYVVASWRDPDNAHPLVVVDGLVVVVLALVRAPSVLPRGRKLQAGQRVGGQIPQAHAAPLRGHG